MDPPLARGYVPLNYCSYIKIRNKLTCAKSVRLFNFRLDITYISVKRSAGVGAPCARRWCSSAWRWASRCRGSTWWCPCSGAASPGLSSSSCRPSCTPGPKPCWPPRGAAPRHRSCRPPAAPRGGSSARSSPIPGFTPGMGWWQRFVLPSLYPHFFLL